MRREEALERWRNLTRVYRMLNRPFGYYRNAIHSSKKGSSLRVNKKYG